MLQAFSLFFLHNLQDFDSDDTPSYRITEKLRGTLEALFQPRNKRQIIYDVMDPRSTLTALDEKSLQDLVKKFPHNNNGK